MNQRGGLPITKFFSTNLSKAASQYLFPICDQKLLLMYPQNREFAQARITISL